MDRSLGLTGRWERLEIGEGECLWQSGRLFEVALAKPEVEFAEVESGVCIVTGMAGIVEIAGTVVVLAVVSAGEPTY